MTTPPPGLPVFAPDDVPDAPQMNAIRTHLRSLYSWAVGGFRYRPRPMVSVRVTAENREATTGTDYAVPFDSADLDTDDMWAALSANTVWVNTAGLYLIGFHARLVSNTGAPGAANLQAWICQGGNDPQTQAIAGGTSGDRGPTAGVVTVAPLARGDKLQFVINQTAGMTLALAPDFATTRAWAIWLGP